MNANSTRPTTTEVTGIAAGALAGAVEGSQTGADPAVEAAYWQQHYRDLPSIPAGASYDEYAPAFQYGWESRSGCCARPPSEGRSFTAAESDLRERWQEQPVAADLSWDEARDAVRAAWERVEQAIATAEPKPSAR
jgi:hypothetical protein